MPGNDDEGQEGPPDTRPYLCIPYWDAPLTAGGSWDDGQQRPLPTAVVSYLCSSIHASAYEPGEPLTVSIDVRNAGGGSAASVVTVVVYWADPTVGFAHPNFFAATTVSVVPSRTAAMSTRSAAMTAVIPASAPGHICLLVAVSHPQDPAGTVCDPYEDRHWAQHNLVAAPLPSGGGAQFFFNVTNPFAEKQGFLLIVRQEGKVSELVEKELGVSVAQDVHPTFALTDGDGKALTEQSDEVVHQLALDGRKPQAFGLAVGAGTTVEPGQAALLEVILQTENERPCGSLGLALIGSKS
ncbi:hypothetical protein [Amnibacterium sp.]|uniref:hypothetical protein n=1 Tax=Amnibacterium sp. TaxID=1872496 RepID=UPI00260706E5|nr:hypothetical protein [Amnibacterium sp.]MCU1474148.1 hypothetical protein [Amnibacterium sp.]